MTDRVVKTSSYEDRPFVLKPILKSIFELGQELKYKFRDNSRLRIYIDNNQEEHTLVYEYFKDNLLSVVKNNPDLPFEVRKVVLRELGLALKDLHLKQWVHLGTK